MGYLALGSHSGGNDSGESMSRKGHVRADVKDLVAGGGEINRFGDDCGDVVDVGKGPLLFSVPEDGHGLLLQNLIHKDPDHVAVAVGDVLPFPVDVVRAEYNIIQAEHLMGNP